MKGRRNTRTLLHAIATVAALLCLHVPDAAAQQGNPLAPSPEPPANSLVYVSDYFSFIGVDEEGRVAFALDNNRGRDGEEWQAEHFVVLHQEGKGWIEIDGNGAYENETNELLAIPNSPFFQFRGTPQSGMTITSHVNNLTLRIDPIPEIVSRIKDSGRFWMGSARAVLEWAGRRLNGRVIYEYLFMPDFNRLSRVYVGLWKEFQGFYAIIDGGGDFYLHSQRSDRLGPLVGETEGFVVLGEEAERLQHTELTILKRAQALGFYRWPTQWRVQGKGTVGPYTLEGSLSDRKVFVNWLSGGFAMGIIQGQIHINGRTLSVYGLAELLM